MITALPGPYGLHRLELENGLRVQVCPRSGSRTIAVCVNYDVGFRTEPPGRWGFAHLFEHLMFQGSASVSPGDHFALVQAAGGTANGSTHPDYTEYFQVVPSDALEQVLFLEADRMRGPLLTADTLRAQIAVVQEEIRMNVLNRPYGGFPWTVMPGILYEDDANAHNGYGQLADIAIATLPACAAFFDAHYAPANAVLTISGDVEPEKAIELARRHFGGIPARAAALPQPLRSRVRTGPRRCEHPDPNATRPATAVGYAIPGADDPASAYCGLVALSLILGADSRARLPRRLIRERGLVTDISAACGLFGPFNARTPDTFQIVATHPPTTGADTVLDAIDTELAALSEDVPSPTELDEVLRGAELAARRRYDDVLAHARAVGASEILFGQPRPAIDLPARLSCVTAHEVRAAAALLRPGNRGVVTLAAGQPRPEPIAAATGRPPAGTAPAAPPPLVSSARVMPASREPELPSPRPWAETTLPTGLRVVAVEYRDASMAEVRLLAPMPVNTDAEVAAAEILASSMFTRTTRQDATQFAATLTGSTATMAATRTSRGAAVTASAPMPELPRLLALLAECLASSDLAADVWVLQRRMVEQLAVLTASPTVAAQLALMAHLYGECPPLADIPRASALGRVTAAELHLARRTMSPSGSVLVVVAPKPLAELIPLVEANFAEWVPAGSVVSAAQTPAMRCDGAIAVVDRPGSVQSQVRLAAPGIPRNDPDFAALSIANAAFGGCFSSRLVTRLREHLGLAYRVHSGFADHGDRVVIGVEVDTATEVTATALAQLGQQLELMTSAPPSRAEITAVRRHMIGMSTVSAATQRAFTDTLASTVFLGQSPDWTTRLLGRLRTTTPEQVTAVARRFYAPSAMTGIVLGDAARIGEVSGLAVR